MKKIILAAFLMIGFIGVSNAQATKKSCAKTCAKGKTASAKACTKAKTACAKTCAKGKTASADLKGNTKVAAAYMEADKLAEANENIERRECATSGKVSYFEKHTCAMSGKTSLTEVKFDQAKKMFVSMETPVTETGELAPKAPLKVGTAIQAVEE